MRFSPASGCDRIFYEVGHMAKEEIGFKHGIPENPDKNWEKQINGQTFTFNKTLERKGLFLYSLQRRTDTRKHTKIIPSSPKVTSKTKYHRISPPPTSFLDVSG